MAFAKSNKSGNKFKPGKSGNPKGRPPTAKLSDALRELLATGNNAEKLALAMFRAAMRGNAKMAALIFERTEGKLAQPITGDPDRPIEVIFRFVDEGIGGKDSP